MDLTSLPYAQRAMRRDVDTPQQPRNTATIASCTYPATSGTVEYPDLQLLDSQSDSTVAIQRSLYFSVSLTIHQLPRCDYHVVASHGPPSLLAISYLVIACATYLLNGPRKWDERKKYSQTIGPMKRSRCEWDWSLTYRLASRSISDLPNLFKGP